MSCDSCKIYPATYNVALKPFKRPVVERHARKSNNNDSDTEKTIFDKPPPLKRAVSDLTTLSIREIPVRGAIPVIKRAASDCELNTKMKICIKCFLKQKPDTTYLD